MSTTSNATELKLNRRNTLAMIDAAAIDVVIHRPTHTRAGNTRGGVTQLDDEVLPSQRFRFLRAPPRRRRQENEPPNQSMGEIPFAKDLLMGRWDADIELGDWFEYLGAKYTITYVFWDKTYETIANLANRSQ